MENKKIPAEDEIQILGFTRKKKEKPSLSRKKKNFIFLICMMSCGVTLLCIIFLLNRETEPQSRPVSVENIKTIPNYQTETSGGIHKGFIEVSEKSVNDVPLYIYTPVNAYMELAIEMPDQGDKSIIFVAQAADIRADNGEIVGDYVLAGKQLARGQRKEGFCAILDKEVIIGMAGETGILTKVIEQGGYFFRQYPLVRDSKVIVNAPKGKSIRRALAIRDKQVIMVESRSRESFHDFAQALADIEVANAIYLCGESAFGWYRGPDGTITTFGKERENLPGTNYLIWKSIKSEK